jgi:hypothetical protein
MFNDDFDDEDEHPNSGWGLGAFVRDDRKEEIIDSSVGTVTRWQMLTRYGCTGKQFITPQREQHRFHQYEVFIDILMEIHSPWPERRDRMVSLPEIIKSRDHFPA